ncbi:pyridoxal phosphate-dependent aminotransferase [Deinococcus detaillensis]|uniref:cysteine-S-conjugate beta-lyase n=1 Tax=Deinococcus detaillensis TaxID=2592048 RepID=A0A553V459_9DEIO|nr:MalY/PatB family protein [Deinococcus detaillensis]TSA87232.1 pyridoxal phosphate-dependent aminotransferase [Deinococcus detaillensis]
MTNTAHPYDTVLPDSLRHADNYKWTKFGGEVLPMWVADMDFPVAPAILSALQGRLSRSVGYPQMPGDPTLKAQLIAKLAKDGLSDLTSEGVAFLPGVVPGLYAAVQALTEVGDEVLTVTPTYPPFLSATTDQGRVLNAVKLIEGKTGWTMDFAALEAAITPKTKLLMLCHPHNPTGRVWTRSELQQLAEFVLKHKLYVVTDELHADLRFSDAPDYVPFAAISPEVAQRTITLTGPCKAYNTAGLSIGAMISHNPDLVAKLEKTTHGTMGHPSALSVTMWQAALSGGAEWLADTLKYLQANRDFLSEFMARELPQVPYTPPEATYLAWLDLRSHPRAADIQPYLLEEAKLALNDGLTFGEGYQGFVRLNFATSRELLQDGLERLAKAVK